MTYIHGPYKFKLLFLLVTFIRIFRISGSDNLFFPNFWMLKDATFMAAEKQRRETFVSVTMSEEGYIRLHVTHVSSCDS